MRERRLRTDLFAQARWLDLARVVVYPRIFLAIFALVVIGFLAASPYLIDPFGKPIGTDFIAFWSAGKLVLGGDPAAAYDYARISDIQLGALPWREGAAVPIFPWHYPPMFLIIAAGLALLLYGAAPVAWLSASLPAFPA